MNPTGVVADAVAVTTKATDAARELTTRYPLTVRLVQLREHCAPHARRGPPARLGPAARPG
ncbi:hypothetical protein [Streptomyces scopuliridis]|uniref:hypothetical protein n=1 Tax=Streptomyces scopuliridis TaxID=452529 RepID=UPI0012FF2675|nr:hypothetical protein [Streptomyces scopuliridis]